MREEDLPTSDKPMGLGAIDNGEPIPMSEEDPNIRVITDMIDFYHTAKAVNIDSCCPEVENFCRAFDSINKGCGCQRKNRVKSAETMYVGLANLSDENKSLIRDGLSVSKVQLFHDAALFSEF